jgi:hypothetical protein
MKTSTLHFIIVFLVVISITISFKGEDDIDTGVSILQPLDAQEEHEGEDADSTTKPKENSNDEQDIDKEESLTTEEKEEPANGEEMGDKVQREEEAQEECAKGERFDFDVNTCIPEEEKVCDDDRDNDNDDKVDLEDSDCQTNDKEIEQKSNEEEQEDTEKLADEKVVDKEEDNNGVKNSPSLEPGNNETISSNDYSAENKAQNSQNLTDLHSAALVTTKSNNTNNSTSSERFNVNGSVIEGDSFTLKCHPTDIQMKPGTERSILCTAENKIPKPIELTIGCLGLDGTGMECYINGEGYSTGTVLLKELSDRDFSILIASESSPPVPRRSYPFSINAECIDTELCQPKPSVIKDDSNRG